jgi:hypothetical protein
MEREKILDFLKILQEHPDLRMWIMTGMVVKVKGEVKYLDPNFMPSMLVPGVVAVADKNALGQNFQEIKVELAKIEDVDFFYLQR